MKQEQDNIKKIFSSKLKNFEEDVPSSVWQEIEKSLDKQMVLKASTASTKKLLYRIVAIAACLILAIIIGYNILWDNHTETNNVAVADNKVLSSMGPKNDSSSNGIILTDGLASRHTPRKSKGRDVFASDLKPYKQYFSVVTSSHIVSGSSDSESESHVQADPQQPNQSVVKDEKEASKNAIDFKNNNVRSYGRSGGSSVSVLPTRRHAESLGNFAVSINSSMGAMSSQKSQNGGMMTFSLKAESLVDEAINKMEDMPLSYSPSYDKDNYDLDHNQPVTFGIKVSKEIAPRWSLETGITYTYLSSTIKSKGATYTEQKQTFHYLGVPVNINYNFLSFGNANFYVSLGGAIQKDVSGRIDSKIEGAQLPDDNMNTEGSSMIKKGGVGMREDIHQKHLQLSGHLGVSVDYPIYQKLYISASVGGVYYFDAKNEYRTVYSDRRTQLDLNLGFKWNF